jgi:hypothetical protein
MTIDEAVDWIVGQVDQGHIKAFARSLASTLNGTYEEIYEKELLRQRETARRVVTKDPAFMREKGIEPDDRYLKEQAFKRAVEASNLALRGKKNERIV